MGYQIEQGTLGTLLYVAQFDPDPISSMMKPLDDFVQKNNAIANPKMTITSPPLLSPQSPSSPDPYPILPYRILSLSPILYFISAIFKPPTKTYPRPGVHFPGNGWFSRLTTLVGSLKSTFGYSKGLLTHDSGDSGGINAHLSPEQRSVRTLSRGLERGILLSDVAQEPNSPLHPCSISSQTLERALRCSLQPESFRRTTGDRGSEQ